MLLKENKALINGKMSVFMVWIALLLRCQYYSKLPANSIQSLSNPKDVFCRKKKKSPIFHAHLQGSQNSQNNVEKKQIWRTHTSLF